jgi:hypothetical protein
MKSDYYACAARYPVRWPFARLGCRSSRELGQVTAEGVGCAAANTIPRCSQKLRLNQVEVLDEKTWYRVLYGML